MVSIPSHDMTTHSTIGTQLADCKLPVGSRRQQ